MLSKATKTVTAAVSIALAVTACDPAVTDKTAGGSEAAESHPSAKADKYKRNPNPKQRYDITMTIANAPGPFGSVHWYADYEAKNCKFMLDRIAGVPSTPKHRIPVEFKKLKDDVYVSAIYLDAMLDEDYFGDGTCHWGLDAASVYLKATGAKQEANFLAGIGTKAILDQASEILYYWTERYPNGTMDDYPEFGEKNIEKFKPEIRDELFTITLTSMRAGQ